MWQGLSRTFVVSNGCGTLCLSGRRRRRGTGEHRIYIRDVTAHADQYRDRFDARVTDVIIRRRDVTSEVR